MKTYGNHVLRAISLAMLVGYAVGAHARDISGNISETLTITEDSQFIGDVTCTSELARAPCIVFGGSDIKLRLNGFTMTGPVDPLTDLGSCSVPGDPNFGVGIRAVGQNHIKIKGPGIIQHFQRWGILLASGVGITVKNVTATRNCWSGLQLLGVSDSEFEGSIWANNAVGSNGAPCGGICLVNSHNNVIRGSIFQGNGTVERGNVDFGVGFEGDSSGNLIERNNFGGNVNGLLTLDQSSGNVIRRNVIVGNPPAQVSATFPGSGGADINERSSGANTFEDNLCLTYAGSGPAPCPNVVRRSESDD